MHKLYTQKANRHKPANRQQSDLGLSSSRSGAAKHALARNRRRCPHRPVNCSDISMIVFPHPKTTDPPMNTDGRRFFHLICVHRWINTKSKTRSIVSLFYIAKQHQGRREIQARPIPSTPQAGHKHPHIQSMPICVFRVNLRPISPG